jgi:hypothetical protein
MADKKPAVNPVWAAAKPFVNGGLSGMMSTVIIQPIDMVKVRLQLGEKGNPVSGIWGLLLPVPTLAWACMQGKASAARATV